VVSEGDLLSFLDEKEEKGLKGATAEDWKQGFAFLFDLGTLYYGADHGHWKLTEDQLTQISTRGRRFYKELTKGKKSAFIKSAEKNFPALMFFGLLIFYVVTRMNESRRREEVKRAREGIRQVPTERSSGDIRSRAGASKAEAKANGSDESATGNSVANDLGHANGNGSGRSAPIRFAPPR
jgi:hypothetical protein